MGVAKVKAKAAAKGAGYLCLQSKLNSAQKVLEKKAGERAAKKEVKETGNLFLNCLMRKKRRSARGTKRYIRSRAAKKLVMKCTPARSSREAKGMDGSNQQALPNC